MRKNNLKNFFVLLALVMSFSCQKTAIEKEQPSGTIRFEIEGKTHTFTISRYLGTLEQGSGVFEAVNADKSESTLIGLIDDTRDNNGVIRDFFHPSFTPDENIVQLGITTKKEFLQAKRGTTKIQITKTDFNKKLIEGTFSFAALGSQPNQEVKVENGYFSIQMPAWLYQ